MVSPPWGGPGYDIGEFILSDLKIGDNIFIDLVSILCNINLVLYVLPRNIGYLSIELIQKIVGNTHKVWKEDIHCG